MSVTTDFLLKQQLQRAERDCAAAVLRVRQSRSMREVRNASLVSVPHLVKSLVRGPISSLRHAAVSRMDALLSYQIADVEALPFENRDNALDRLRATEWIYLRGDFGSLATKAEAARRRLTTPPEAVLPDVPKEPEPN